MNLLLDARKKSQQAQSAQNRDDRHPELELGLEEQTGMESARPGSQPSTSSDDLARNAGKNLFSAKSSAAPRTGGINRNLLFALAGTVLLLAAGAGYWWYVASAGSSTTPLRPINPPPSATIARSTLATTGSLANPKTLPDNDETSDSTLVATSTAPASPTRASPKTASAASLQQGRHARLQADRDQIQHIEHPQAELVDPLLSNAYLAYRNGKLDEAQQLYLAMLKKDAHTPDALLGLAAIAQQRGEPQTAVQYYLRVLTLDPRNALANAGMSALSNDVDNNENRLKTLLREQGNSAALHFALGNLYAAQSRWGEAQQAYFNAYTLEPDSAEFAFNLAVSLDHLGQNKLAAQHYQRALQLDQSHSAGIDHERISRRAQELTR